MVKVINLIAGPGSGKSTTALGLSFLMKVFEFNVELVTEYVKEAAYEGRMSLFDDQLYIFAKQYRRMHILKEKVDYIITDSPLLLSLLYAKDNYFDYYAPLVDEVFHTFENYTIFLNRDKPYKKLGRYQNEQEAIEMDKKIKDYLLENKYKFTEFKGNASAPFSILNHLLKIGFISSHDKDVDTEKYARIVKTKEQLKEGLKLC